MKKPGNKRFTLKQMLAITAFAGLVIANIMLAVQLQRARSELEMLRRESGHLVFRDKEKIHLIAAPALGQHQWRWRIYAPPNIAFDCGVQFGNIPPTGIPDNENTQRIRFRSDPSGILLTLDATRDMNGRMVMGLQTEDFSLFSPTTKPVEEWLTGSGMIQTAGTLGQESFGLDEPIILRRCRIIKDESLLRFEEDAEYGHMVWLMPIAEE